MFEVGRRYEFHTREADEEVMFWGVVEKYDHPLVKLADTPALVTGNRFGDETIPGAIINVTSPNFVRAVIDERD